jgi:type I restriction enzyme S subunit
MKFGLDDKVIEQLTEVFEASPKVDKAYIFGSRAKGNYRADSDIDIAIKGYGLTLDDILKMSVAFEDKGITHKIDLLDYSEIKEPALVEHIDRVGIEFYSRWKKVSLQDVVSKLGDGLHGTPNYDNNGEYYFINGNNLINGKIVIKDSTQKVTIEEYLKYKKDINNRTILLGINGTIGNVAIYNGEKCILGKSACYFNVIDGVSKDFIKYVITDTLFQSYIENFANGSTIKNVSLKTVRDFEFLLPPLKEQAEIALVLNGLDNKIDLLHRQNKTLEQLAETLFRQWFVEEAEEGWKVEPLGKVFDIGIGRTPPRKEQHWFSLNPDDIKWASIKDMGTSGLYIDTVSEYLTQEAVDKFNIPLIPENTVMLSFKMTIGRLAITTGQMLSNEAIAHFIQKEKSFLFPEFLYLFLATFRWEELGSTSSIVEAINSQMIKEIDMVIPDEQKLKAFKVLIKPYFKKIKSNQTQIQSLTKMRDTLLPKLMSGEVRVAI